MTAPFTLATQTMTNLGPLHRYKQLVANGELRPDEQQHQAIKAVDAIYQQLSNGKQVVKGVYLYGAVGRGKSLIMNLLSEALGDVICKRIHFHHFMQDVHLQLRQLQGDKDPLTKIANDFAAHYRILCFDEFLVEDIADAMLLGRLLQALFKNDICLVTTSNTAANMLYYDGLQRQQFVPAINALHKNVQVLRLDGDTDHRRDQTKTAKSGRYTVISDSLPIQHNRQLLNTLGLSYDESNILLLGRQIACIGKSHDSIAFEFDALCKGPRSQLDYIELCQHYREVVLLNVPVLSSATVNGIKAHGTEDGAIGSGNTGRRNVLLGRNDDAVRRFIALIDECYEKNTAIFISASVEINKLYPQGRLFASFQRSVSRLHQLCDVGSQ